jgi:hypothetical protein
MAQLCLLRKRMPASMGFWERIRTDATRQSKSETSDQTSRCFPQYELRGRPDFSHSSAPSHTMLDNRHAAKALQMRCSMAPGQKVPAIAGAR